MPVLKPLLPFFNGLIASADTLPDDGPVAKARVAMHAMIDASFSKFMPQHPPVASERDYRIPVAGGVIRLRVYAPVGAGATRPCHLNLHGGGFWLGTLEQGESSCRSLATDADCIVASVDYRLAPEHKFPAAPEDCYAALLWVVEHASELGIDPTRISVGGGSAGGNLAAVVTLMARDRGGPSLVLQVLEIPVTDFTNLEPLRIPDEGLVIPSGKDKYRAHYLSDLGEATNSYASPLLAENLKELPPALIMCAEYDPLRPEGEAYASRLIQAGISVEYHCWKGQFHGSQQMALLIPDQAAAYHERIVHALRRAYGTSQV